MSCNDGAAFNGEPPAKIKILSGDAKKKSEKEAAFNGTNTSENQNFEGLGLEICM